METITQLSPFRQQDVKATMTPRESFNSNVASADYAIHALSNPDDDTYRKNLARYLDTKGLDLTSNGNNELYVADRNSLEMKPVTRSFVGELVGSAPEIAGAILGSRAGVIGAGLGSMGGDMIQQGINSQFLGEELEPKQRAWEQGKSALLGSGGEVIGNTIGRMVTPLRDFAKSKQLENTALAEKYGVELTPATATEHTGMQWFEEVMAKGSLGGKSIAKAKEAEITGVENTARNLLENKMGATGDAFDSGSSLAYNVGKQQEMAEGYFNQRYGKLVEDAGISFIPVGTLRGTANEIIQQSEKIPAFKNGIDLLAKRIIDSPKALSYKDYQQLRSFIGAKIKDSTQTGQSGSTAAYKRLYKAVNDDFDNMFIGSDFRDAKIALDTEFKDLYKKPFENGFTRGVTGAGNRNKIDAERIGGLVSTSSQKARAAANTADSGFVPRINTKGETTGYGLDTATKPKESMSAAADYILGRSVAADGGMSLPKVRTNLKKATGVDALFKADKKSKETALETILGAKNTTTGMKAEQLGAVDFSNLKQMKTDIVKLIELSGANNKVANSSGTAWMNEMMRMKNDPMRAIAGFVSDLGMATTYNRKMFQKWLTNDLITEPQYRQLLNATVQGAERSVTSP